MPLRAEMREMRRPSQKTDFMVCKTGGRVQARPPGWLIATPTVRDQENRHRATTSIKRLEIAPLGREH